MREAARVGVLALQGDFAAHAAALRRAGAGEAALVRRPSDLAGLSGLALPGGESTTLLRLLALTGLDEALPAFARDGGALLATCAGAILLSREVTAPRQASLGVLDAVIERNSYGRQVDSFVGAASLTPEGEAALGPGPLEAVFIRAPRFLEVGAGVTVLATCGGAPVLVRQGTLLASTFHPELTADLRVHAHFAALARPEAVALL